MDDFNIVEDSPQASILFECAAEALGFMPVRSLVLIVSTADSLGPILRYDWPSSPQAQWAEAVGAHAARTLSEFLAEEGATLKALICDGDAQRDDALLLGHGLQKAFSAAVLERAFSPGALSIDLVRGAAREAGPAVTEEDPVLAAVISDVLEAVGCATAEDLQGQARQVLGALGGGQTHGGGLADDPAGEALGSSGAPPATLQLFEDAVRRVMRSCAEGAPVPAPEQGRICPHLKERGYSELLLSLVLEAGAQGSSRSGSSSSAGALSAADAVPGWGLEGARRLQMLLFRWEAACLASAGDGSSAPGRGARERMGLVVRIQCLAAWLYWLQGCPSKAMAYLQICGLDARPSGDPLQDGVIRLCSSGTVSEFARKRPQN